MEVLIALAVLAIAMAALVKSAGGFTSNQAYLENKTIAHWVAMNQLALIRTGTGQVVGDEQGQEEMAGRMWSWHLQLLQTPNPKMLEAKVTVQAENSEAVLALLSGYIMVRQ
jgi:general secretion pathway protein I